MARTLSGQALELQRVMAELVKKYQFRDRGETVGYGLSVSQAYALRSLHENGPLSMGELAADMHLSVSTMTRVVDKLVRKSLARRVADRDDRRVCRVALSARGRELWLRVQADLVESDVAVLRALAPAEREGLIRAIGLLCGAVDMWRARAAGRPEVA